MPPLSRTWAPRIITASARRTTTVAQWPHAARARGPARRPAARGGRLLGRPRARGTHSHAGGVQVSLPVGDGTQPERGRLLARGRRAAGGAPAGPARSASGRELPGRPAHRLRRGADPGPPPVRRARRPRRSSGTCTPPWPTTARGARRCRCPAGGDYRVIAEFVARDEGGNGDHVVLGETVPVGRRRPTAPARPGARVEVTEEPVVGPDGRLMLRVRDDRGPPGARRHLPRDVRPRHRLPARQRRDGPPAPARRRPR